MLFAPRCRRARSEKAVICFCPCLYQVFSRILGVSLPPSRRFHPLYAVPPPSSEGGKGAPAPCAEINCFGKEDSNERNPSGVRFYSRRLCLAKARRGRSRAMHRISLGEHKEPRLMRIFAPCGYFHENLYKKQPAAFRKSTKRKQRAVRSWVFGENARHDSAKDAGFSPTYG